MALIHLIYVSHSPKGADVAELERILESAVRHNTPQQVTGMLLYANGSFMQVLEGEEAAVMETFNRVLQDPRHEHVIELEREPIAQRSFSQWSMGFRSVGVDEAAKYPAYAAFFSEGFDAEKLGAREGLALEMLKDFARTQR